MVSAYRVVRGVVADVVDLVRRRRTPFVAAVSPRFGRWGHVNLVPEVVPTDPQTVCDGLGHSSCQPETSGLTPKPIRDKAGRRWWVVYVKAEVNQLGARRTGQETVAAYLPAAPTPAQVDRIVAFLAEMVAPKVAEFAVGGGQWDRHHGADYTYRPLDVAARVVAMIAGGR